MFVRTLAGFAALSGAFAAVAGCGSEDAKDQRYGTDADVDYHFPDGGQRDIPREARGTEAGDGTGTEVGAPATDGGLVDVSETEAGDVDAPADDAGGGMGG